MSDQAINPRLFERSPCYRCGYNGPGYYQPDMHACAKDYHEHVRSQARTREELLAMVAQLRGELATAEETYRQDMGDMQSAVEAWRSYAVRMRGQAREIIQGLLDVQNGCPLPKYQHDFDRINATAVAFLGKTDEDAL